MESLPLLLDNGQHPWEGVLGKHINEAEPGFCWGKEIEKKLGNMLEKITTTTKMKP